MSPFFKLFFEQRSPEFLHQFNLAGWCRIAESMLETSHGKLHGRHPPVGA